MCIISGDEHGGSVTGFKIIRTLTDDEQQKLQKKMKKNYIRMEKIRRKIREEVKEKAQKFRNGIERQVSGMKEVIRKGNEMVRKMFNAEWGMRKSGRQNKERSNNKENIPLSRGTERKKKVKQYE